MPGPIVPQETIELRILVLRDQKVMLDGDLATLYGVETRALTQAVRRNIQRFPEDFMFRLTLEEWRAVRQQLGDRPSWGGRRTEPRAFTEQGVAMLSSVLSGPRAIAVNIQIMRAFVRLRAVLAQNAELVRRLDQLEHRYDEQIRLIVEAIQQMVEPQVRPRSPVGFVPPQQ
jgi:hypothetical protein